MGIISELKERREIRRIARLFLKTRDVIDSTLKMRVRSELEYPPVGQNETLDQALIDGLNFFVVQGINPQVENSLSADANKVYEWLCKDSESKNEMGLRTRVLHLRYRMAHNEEAARERASVYRSSFNEELKPLDLADLSDIHYDARSKNQTVKIEFDRLGKRLIKFELKGITQALTIFSALLLVAGYWHTSHVYKHFGIDATQFFSIGDYVASSVAQIQSSLYLLLGMAAALFRRYHRQDVTTIDTVELRGRAFINYWWDNLLLFAGLLFLFMHLRQQFWLLLPIGIFVATEKWVIAFANKFFEHSYLAYIRIILVSLFLLGVYSSAKVRILNIKDERLEKPFVIEAVDRTFTNRDHIFLGGNSRYIFLLKKDFLQEKKDGTQIIPLEKVKNMAMFERRAEQTAP